MGKINWLMFALGKYDENAVRNCTDQAQLAKIAKTHKETEMRKTAVMNLTEQSALADVAKNAEDNDVRKAAVEKLTDQAALADVAKNGKDNDVRKAAVEKLTDQSVLMGVVLSETDVDVRKAAVDNKQLTDQGFLLVFALGDAEWRVRGAAVRKLTDQTLLATVAENDKNWIVRLLAADMLNDKALAQSVYMEAMSAENPFLRQIAVNSLTGQTLLALVTKLAHMAKNDENKDVREAATKRLKELSSADVTGQVIKETESKKLEEPQQISESKIQGFTTGAGVCDVCERPLSGVTTYSVPNKVFWDSKTYLVFYVNKMMSTGMSKHEATMQYSIGKTHDDTPSAVCEDCIHMFK